jgi:hypothetical protein
MARRRQRCGALIAVAVSLICARSSAEAPARVRIVLPACEDAFDQGELVRILRIELAAEGVREVVVGDARDVLASIRVDAVPCSRDAREIDLSIDDAATGKSVKRAIEIGDVPGASRPRALALATAELLRASWAELSMPDAPAPTREVPEGILRAVKLRPPPANVPPSPSPSRPAEARTPPLAHVALDVRTFPSYQSVVLGPALGLSVPLGSLPLRARADGRAGFGKAYDALGTIDLTLVTGDVGLALTAGTESVRLDIGPLVAVGGAWASGTPTVGATGSRASAVVATAELAAQLAVRVAPGWWSVVGLAAGAVLQSLDAQAAGRPASGFGGPLLGVSLGVGHDL